MSGSLFMPGRRLRFRFAFTIDDANAQFVAQHRLRHWPDRQRFSRAGSRDDSESLSRRTRFPHQIFRMKALSERRQVGAMLAPKQCLDVEAKREYNRLTGRARGRDDDDASCSPLRDECVVVGREVRVADAAEQRRLSVYCGFSGLTTAFGSGAFDAAAAPPGAVAVTPETPVAPVPLCCDAAPRASPATTPGPRYPGA